MEEKDKNRTERRTDGKTEEGIGSQSRNYEKQ
jgi:hypothetical protein